jgi:hypothetical protein
MRATMNGLPSHLRKAVRDLSAAGGRVTRDGNCLSIDGPAVAADAVSAHAEELAQYVLPAVTAEEAKLVRGLLADAGAGVAYVTAPDAARQIVAGIVVSAPDVIGLDFETEVLPEFRQPIPIRFNKTGNLAVRQPHDGAAGAALDPYRSKVRLVKSGPVASVSMSSICAPLPGRISRHCSLCRSPSSTRYSKSSG